MLMPEMSPLDAKPGRDVIPVEGTGSPACGAERADAAENRRRILQTAQRLFDAHGVAGVNMVDIAKETGVGQGTLYRRFASKSALCLALMDTQMREFQEAVFAALRDPRVSGREPLAQLCWFVRELCKFQERHLPYLCEVDVPVEAGNHAWQWQHMTVHGLLGAAQRAGQLQPALDIGVTGETVIGAMHPGVFMQMRQGRGYSVERIAEGVAALVLALRR